MEILHHMRPRRDGVNAFRNIARFPEPRAMLVAPFAFMLFNACGGRDEARLPTADSAAVHGSLPGDTGPTYTVPPPVDTLGSITTSDAPTWPEPSMILAADSVAGQRIYRRNASCITCHGPLGTGVQGLGKSLEDTEWLHGDGSLSFLYRVIRDGITDPRENRVLMPAYRQLPPEEIFRIAAYVYAISREDRTVVDSSALPPGSPPIALPPPDTAQRQ